MTLAPTGSGAARPDPGAGLDLQEGVPLAPFSTLGVGGPARWLARAHTVEQVAAATAWARAHGHPLLVLGGGSNLVLADEGFPGLVLRIALGGLRTEPESGAVRLRAGAGEDWDGLVAHAVAQGWAGVECLSGIPGLAGATPIQNVGAYGQDVSETIVEVEAFDRRAERVVHLDNAACRFGYRQSRFKGEDADRYVVLAVTYRLRPGGAPAVRYPELEKELAGRGLAEPGLADVREAVLGLRRRKSMVLDPADPDSRSVGSFFMNPIVAAEVAEAVARRAEPPVPAWPAGEGRVKLSAAWLIERSGLGKGYRRGRAGLSRRHTLAIVNADGASAAEVVELAREVRARVHDRFGVTLQPEPVLVGVSL